MRNKRSATTETFEQRNCTGDSPYALSVRRVLGAATAFLLWLSSCAVEEQEIPPQAQATAAINAAESPGSPNKQMEAVWTTVDRPDTVIIEAVTFSPDGTAWLAGGLKPGGELYWLGQTGWQPKKAPPSKTGSKYSGLKGICFTGNGSGWAVGLGAQILHSSDRGDSWQLEAPPAGGEEFGLTGLNCSDTGIWAFGGGPSVWLRTDDGWQSRSPSEPALGAVEALVADKGNWLLALANYTTRAADGSPRSASNLQESRDAGRNWRVVASPTDQECYGLILLKTTEVVLLPCMDGIWTSSDQAATWSRLFSYSREITEITDRQIPAAWGRMVGGESVGRSVWLYGGTGLILYSPDSGATWQRETIPSAAAVDALAALPDGRAFAIAVGTDTLLERSR